MQNQGGIVNSTLTLDNRKRLSISGVSEVLGFSETAIKLSIGNDRLFIVGEKLKITAFNKASGNFTCDGEITEMKYGVKKQPLIKRIFK